MSVALNHINISLGVVLNSSRNEAPHGHLPRPRPIFHLRLVHDVLLDRLSMVSPNSPKAPQHC